MSDVRPNETQKTKHKLNSIDKLIIAVLVLAVAAVGAKFIWDKVNDKTAMYYITFYGEETPDYVTDKVEIGGALTDDNGYAYLGVVTGIETAPSVAYAPDDNGIYVMSSKEGYSSVKITGIVTATAFDNGIMIGGNRYTAGHTMTLRAGDGKFYLRVMDITKATDEQIANEPALKLADADK